MNRPPAAGKAGHVEIAGRATAAAALQAILGVGLEHLRANQVPAAAGDTEGVHQMRVAIRRLRAGLVLFEPLLEPAATGRLQQALRRTGQVFGGARDWDVFCLEALPACLAQAGRGQALQPLRDAAEARRRSAHGGFVERLADPAYAQLVDELVRWAADRPAVAKHRRRRIGGLAPDLLGRLARKVDRRGRHLRRRSVEELHALRKSLKKLRYGADDLSSLFAAKRAKSFRHGCKALQETLGEINDAAAAGRMAESLGASLPRGAGDAVEAVVLWSHHRRDAALRKLPRAWEEFCEAPRFWE